MYRLGLSGSVWFEPNKKKYEIMTINIIFIKMNVRRMALFSIHAAAFHGILRAFFECEEFVCRAKLIPQEKWLYSDFPHARRSNLSE